MSERTLHEILLVSVRKYGEPELFHHAYISDSIANGETDLEEIKELRDFLDVFLKEAQG